LTNVSCFACRSDCNLSILSSSSSADRYRSVSSHRSNLSHYAESIDSGRSSSYRSLLKRKYRSYDDEDHGYRGKKLSYRRHSPSPSLIAKSKSQPPKVLPSAPVSATSLIRNPWFSELPIEWWERDDDCKDAKSYHLSKIDRMFSDREELVLQTTLWDTDTALEANMFPYTTPPGILHYTLWSRYELSHEEVIAFVDNWLSEQMPQVRRWQYDDNSGERSIMLFHVHVFIETIPFSFCPRPDEEYFPPHVEARRPTNQG
jgi:hypothetical protein